jgi:hypothetical protein
VSPARKAPAARKKTPPAQKKGGTAKREPKPSPELREAVEQDLVRAEELDALYRPLREAGEAELAKTKSGRKLLEEIRAFGTELADLYQSIDSGKTPYEKGHRLARRRREEFTEKYQQQFLDAYAPHARLQPSVEAVAQILRPEMSPQTSWVVETRSPGSMLLQPKPVPGEGEQAYPTQGLVPAGAVVPDDLEAVSQGLGDPMTPQPVRACLGPPYTRQEEHSVAALFGSAVTYAPDNGLIYAVGHAWGTPFVPVQATTASAWVGHDFQVPAGIISYTATVDYYYKFYGAAALVLPGVATVSLNVAILIDKGDATPPDKSAHAIHLMTVPVYGWDHFDRIRSETATVMFRRAGSSTQDEPSNGTVRVMVGVDGHSVAIGPGGATYFAGDVGVRQICVNSAV